MHLPLCILLFDHLFQLLEFVRKVKSIVAAEEVVADFADDGIEVAQGVDAVAVSVLDPGTVFSAATKVDGCLEQFKVDSSALPSIRGRRLSGPL